MVHPSLIEARLGELNFKTTRWFRAEVLELQHILMDDERIIHLACGRNYGSFALLVATDQRLLLIDKRVFFMNYEDIRYDMISEIDFNKQVYSTNLTLFTGNKIHKFTSYRYKQQLRDITNYVQNRVAELRNQRSTVPDSQMPAEILHQLPRQQPSGSSLVRGQSPPLGTAYTYTPLTTDDARPAFTEHPSGVAQMVGSTAMQGSGPPLAAPNL